MKQQGALMETELAERILDLQAGDHLCLLYEKDPAEQMPALVPFIRDGLFRDEQFIYIADDQTVDELAGRLEQGGIDVGKECDRGALKLWTRREWRQRGKLSSERKSLQVLQLLDEASRAGFKGSRFAVEMTWVLGPDIDARQLEHWEATLNNIFYPGFPGKIVCQYNRSRLAPEVIFASLRTHPLAVFGDEVYANIFYEAPLILDDNENGNGKSAAARVEWMIAQLQRARAAEKARAELIRQRAALGEQQKLLQALRRKEQELHSLNLELEKRVAERTADLRRANAAIIRDMEERIGLEDQLRQAQKMESIGTLAGGIAHDFNNILNIIQGYSTLLSTHAGDKAEIADSLSVINEAIKRGAGVVQQLLTLARKSESVLETTDVNAVFGGLVELVKGTFPKNIEVTMDLSPELPPLLADANQLNQALLNLCVNARDAMPEGGKLGVKTRVVDGKSLPDYVAPKAERFVRIEISDNGIGIDENLRSRIFEPFFTTKDSENGTGLGLAVVYGVVKNHQGYVDVQSAPGAGTTFQILLPILTTSNGNGHRDPAQEAAHEPTADGSYGTALVIEDEEAVLHLLRNILAERGYRVLTAMDGAAAVRMYRHNKETIDVVLLDLDLPRISGTEVLRQIREENSRARVVVTSGYLEPELKAALICEGVTRFISKPYMPDEVVAALEAPEGRPVEEIFETIARI
jgi:signal transduction histidine kinase/ActR/RegA family two-component response regulator